MPTSPRGEVFLQFEAPRRDEQIAIAHVQTVGMLQRLAFRKDSSLAISQDMNLADDHI